MLTTYAPVLVLLGIAVAFAAGSLIISDLLGRKRLNREKASAYECGMDAVGSARIRLSIHFYLVAVLFILFDVEAIFLILWAVNAQEFASAGVGGLIFVELMAFMGVLGLALAYVWRKGGLSWDH